MQSSRKRIVPGDLVIQSKVMFEAAVVTRYGFVIAVRHPREGAHMGCEERIDVMWEDSRHSERFETLCDCELLLVDSLLGKSASL